MKKEIFVNRFPLVKYTKRYKITFDTDPVQNFYKKIKSGKSYFKQSLANKTDDYFYSIEQGNDFGVKTTFVAIWISKKWSEQELIELVSLAHFYYPDSLNIEVCIPTDIKLQRKFEKVGFKVKGYQLYGRVESTFNILSREETSMAIKKWDGRNINQFARLIYASHSDSTTSFAKKATLKSAKQYLKMCKDRSYDVFVGEINNKVICTITPIRNSWGIGHIMDISILPEYKGQGLSKLLYRVAMEYFRERNITVYSGCSGSKEVISFSQKLKRDKVGLFMSLSVE